MQAESLDAAAVEASQPQNPAEERRPIAVRSEIREMARQLGVDLASLAGSGPDGDITRADVLRAASDVTGLVRPPLVAAEGRRDAERVVGAAVRR